MMSTEVNFGLLLMESFYSCNIEKKNDTELWSVWSDVGFDLC